MLDFICMGSVDLRGALGKLNIPNEKFLPTAELEPTTLRFVGRRSSRALLEELIDRTSRFFVVISFYFVHRDQSHNDLHKI